MAYHLDRLPPVSKQAEEEQDTFKSMKRSLELLTQGIVLAKGQVYGYDVALTQDAMPTFIDFLQLKNNINVPAGTAIVTPGFPLVTLRLVNIGAGTVKFSIGLSVNEGGTTTLLAGAVAVFKAHRPMYKSLTLRAIGANATVNVGMES